MPTNQGIRIKSYFAASFEAAVELAREELGPEAMLLRSRKNSSEPGSAGNYEVVFGVPPQGGETSPRQNPKVVVMGAPESGECPPDAGQPYVPKVRAGLSDTGLPMRFVEEVLDAFEHRLERESAVQADERDGGAAQVPPAGAPDLLRYELRSRITVSPELGREGVPRSVAALVGPPGAGKTLSLVKLALTEGVAKNRGVQVVTLDTHRIFASEQLESCAAILSAGFHVVREPESLAEILQGCPPGDLVLIDTPGLSAAETSEVAELAQTLSTIEDLDVHLVLPATLNFDDATCAVGRFLPVRPDKLLLTRVDEASQRGPAFAVAALFQIPISYFCCGQRMAEDIRPASREALVDMLMQHVETRMLSAA
jgi:flagellar biosynthesis GTPase FlhF